jgi:hypothetical protein
MLLVLFLLPLLWAMLLCHVAYNPPVVMLFLASLPLLLFYCC